MLTKCFLSRAVWLFLAPLFKAQTRNTTMKFAILLLSLLVAVSAQNDSQTVPEGTRTSDCNICGEGNTIQFGTGSVEFVYQGETRKNNCNTWQNIVKNPNTIDPEFCKGEMLMYTAEICRCTDEFGNPVKYVPPGETDSSETKDDTSSSSLLPVFSVTSLVALMAMVLEM